MVSEIKKLRDDNKKNSDKHEQLMEALIDSVDDMPPKMRAKFLASLENDRDARTSVKRGLDKTDASDSYRSSGVK
jgi:hypothetical protein